MDQSVVNENNGVKPKMASNVSKLDELIPELRHRFLEISSASPEDYDPIDLETIKTNDFQIKRFLLNNELKEKESLDQLIEAMKWRKTFGLKRDFSHCAVESFHCGGIFIYGQDREERPVLYVRTKTYVKIPHMEDSIKDMLATTLDQLDQRSKGNGFAVVMDMSGAGLANADMGMARFMITVLRNYFPGALSSCIIVNLPTILKSFIPLVKLLLGSKARQMLHAITGDQLFQYIHPDFVPKYLGGNSTYDFTQPPEECTKTAEEMGALNNMSPNTVRKALKKFEPHMTEAKALVSGKT